MCSVRVSGWILVFLVTLPAVLSNSVVQRRHRFRHPRRFFREFMRIDRLVEYGDNLMFDLFFINNSLGNGIKQDKAETTERKGTFCYKCLSEEECEQGGEIEECPGAQMCETRFPTGLRGEKKVITTHCLLELLISDILDRIRDIQRLPHHTSWKR